MIKQDDLKYWQLQIEKATRSHNDSLARLRRPDGKPLYADDVMQAQARQARQTLTAELDKINAAVGAIADDAAKTAAAGRGDIYAWLDNDELQRAALLRTFIREDVEAMGNDGLRDLEFKTRANGGQIDRVKAWLLMREANMRDLPALSFERSALPENLAAVDAIANDARTVQGQIKQVRPETAEHLQRNIMGNANWSATGEFIAAS